jgi:carbonic anhydrase
MDWNERIAMRLWSWMLLPVLTMPVAHAAKWVNVAEGLHARALYLDTDSLQRDGTQIQAWTREVFTEEQRSPHTGVLYFSASTLTRFECMKRTIAPLTRVFYGGDGTELRRINLDQVELPELTTPGSLQERLLDEACRPPVAKKPAATQLAQAETKTKTDVPPGAAAEPAKAVADKDSAKPVKEPAKPEGAAAAKPLDPKNKMPEPAKTNAVPKQAATSLKPVAAEPSKAAPRSAPRYVEYKALAPRTYHLKVKHPTRVALLDADKHAKSEKSIEHEVHWSYEGSNGPQHWAELKPEFAACGTGKRQSPIDIQDGARLELEPIKIDYRPTPLRILDNSHTVQVNYAEGSSISIAGVRYDLKQFHFHKPAEERVNGKVYDMVAHLVHASADGRLAVIAVLMETGAQNDFLAGLWPHLPLEAGREIALPEVMIDVTTLLPESRAYYAYMGSLTTPPCSEGVLWLVMKTPVSISAAQTAVFGKLYKMNARPVQAGNGRLIKESL